MGIARIRVEAKGNPNGWEEREKSFKNLMTAFRKAYQRSGIGRDLSKYESYEKPGDKRRRKKRESQANVLKEQMKREQFRSGYTEKKEYE